MPPKRLTRLENNGFSGFRYGTDIIEQFRKSGTSARDSFPNIYPYPLT
jgi:hypothetical protein